MNMKNMPIIGRLSLGFAAMLAMACLMGGLTLYNIQTLAELSNNMYRHPRVIDVMTQAEGVVADLFARFMAHPEDLPGEWAQGLDGTDTFARARRIADFIAGMTDRFALTEHARLFDSSPAL